MMNASVEAVLILAVLAVIVLAVSMVSRNKTEKEKFVRKTQKSWGGGKPPVYTEEAFREIRNFSDALDRDSNQQSADFQVDDITWNDSDMDSVFQMVNRTLSSPGEDVLYAWLRHPLLNQKKLKTRDALITKLEQDDALRQKTRMIAYRIGRGKKTSYFSDALKAAAAPEEGSGKYIFLCFLTIFSIAMLFVQPVAGIVILVADFIINIVVGLKTRTDYRSYIHGFRAILRMLSGTEELLQLDLPELAGEKEKAAHILEDLRPFRRGAFFVTGSGSVGTGIGDVILEYVNLFFHLDMIQFGKMAGLIRGKEQEIRDLTEFAGTADAAASVASFRELLKKWCRPELESTKKGFIKADGLYHPLLASPMKNSIFADGGILITGANASGKSTFLKSVSIGTILGQSICTVPADRWQASFLRVYTSMALNDNLFEGESYFVVEIRSLKRIMDAAAKEDAVPVLGMIDEVLRGTNTIERIAASSQVLQKLSDGKSLIFAATHDIELTQILKDSYHNYHFSGEVKDRDVKFDYTIKEGPTRERNAIALMAAAGYDPQLAQKAEETARHFEKTGEWRV